MLPAAPVIPLRVFGEAGWLVQTIEQPLIRRRASRADGEPVPRDGLSFGVPALPVGADVDCDAARLEEAVSREARIENRYQVRSLPLPPVAVVTHLGHGQHS